MYIRFHVDINLIPYNAIALFCFSGYSSFDHLISKVALSKLRRTHFSRRCYDLKNKPWL